MLFLGPRCLVPSDIAEILLESEAEEPEQCHSDENNDSHDSLHSKEDLLFYLEQDAGNQGTSITLPLDKKVRPSIDYYSATKACQLLLESNYEASADEETSAHYTSSSDTKFDLSNPDAGMDDATYCDNDYTEVGETSPIELHPSSDGEEPGHNYGKLTKSSRSRTSVLIAKEVPASKSKRVSIATKTAVAEASPIEEPHPNVSDNDSYISSSSEEPVRKSKTSKKKSTATSRARKVLASNSRKAPASNFKRKASTCKTTTASKDLVPDLPTHSISEPDEDSESYEKFQFSPSRNVGVHLPPGINDTSPLALFQLFFAESIVNFICKSSDEYAELMKEKLPRMHSTYSQMNIEDFLKLLGILLHFGYRKIPRYRLAWKQSSLCYDPFISSVMGRNKFESLMTFLHVTDKSTEERLKVEGDKLLKVTYLCILLVAGILYMLLLCCYYKYVPTLIIYSKNA